MIGGAQQKLFGLFVVLVNRPAVGAAQLDRVGDNSRQHGFKVERRAYDLTDFAEGFELAHRARQFVGSLIQFFKQPHVLDGDDGLVGEGFKQFDLRRGEGAHLGTTRVSIPMNSPCRRRGTAKKVRKRPKEPNIGKSFCARMSGMWSVPCSRIQRICGSSILISTRPTGMEPK